MYEIGAPGLGHSGRVGRFSAKVLAQLFAAAREIAPDDEARAASTALLALIAHHPPAHQALADLRQMARDAGIECSDEIGAWALSALAAHEAFDRFAAGEGLDGGAGASLEAIGPETLRQIAEARRRRGDARVDAALLARLDETLAATNGP